MKSKVEKGRDKEICRLLEKCKDNSKSRFCIFKKLLRMIRMILKRLYFMLYYSSVSLNPRSSNLLKLRLSLHLFIAPFPFFNFFSLFLCLSLSFSYCLIFPFPLFLTRSLPPSFIVLSLSLSLPPPFSPSFIYALSCHLLAL